RRNFRRIVYDAVWTFTDRPLDHIDEVGGGVWSPGYGITRFIEEIHDVDDRKLESIGILKGLDPIPESIPHSSRAKLGSCVAIETSTANEDCIRLGDRLQYFFRSADRRI